MFKKKPPGKNSNKYIFLGGFLLVKRYAKKKKKKINIKKIVRNLLFVFLVGAFGFWMYQTYTKININTQGNTNSIEIQRTSQTVEEVKEKDKKIEEMLQESNEAIVGISKIKDNGSSIFLKDSEGQLGLGTGFIVSENGYIVTNQHVSGEKYSTCYVTLENGKVYNASVVWSDNDIDLSIVKINAKGLKYVPLGDSDENKVGQSVYAIGNPIGFEFQRTVTSGIISALSRTIKFEENGKEVYMANLIQTDATINPGNSGGPLINTDGKVIGINSIKINSAEGIGFAIPINTIKPIVDKYIQTGNFEEANIGIFAYDKDVIPYLDSNLKLEAGIYVAQVITNSPAQKAGIKIGDIITKIDGIELNKMCDLREYIYTKNPEDTVTLTIQKGITTSSITLILGKK